jgi:tRNA (adenine57-N1/adenine58-N1)-methyltransferase
LSRSAQDGDTALVILPDRKRLITRLAAGTVQHTHLGSFAHDAVIGGAWGREFLTNTGRKILILRPSLEEVLSNLPREGQIIFAKDIGYILLKLDIRPGRRVIEAGTGSGALAVALAHYVTASGQLYTYEQRADMFDRSGRNLAAAGLTTAVTRHLRDIGEGFLETDVDALFLDVREPWLYLRQAAHALADGAFFGALVPTVNQLAALTAALDAPPFADLEIAELMLRQYKPVPERIRPQDRMTAHTGYLVFARKRSEAEASEPSAAAEVEVPGVADLAPDAPGESGPGHRHSALGASTGT